MQPCYELAYYLLILFQHLLNHNVLVCSTNVNSEIEYVKLSIISIDDKNNSVSVAVENNIKSY